MNKLWTMILIAVCVLAGTFYAGRLSIESSSTRSSPASELSDSSETRSASRRPRVSADSPRSAILRKSMIVNSPSAANQDGDWVTIPKEEFIKLSKAQYGYYVNLGSKSGKFDEKLLDGFGVPEEARVVLNQAVKNFGKELYQLRDKHTEFSGGKDENSAVVEFGNFDHLLAPHQEKLRESIVEALGQQQGELFTKVAKLDAFFSDREKMFSGGRINLTREVKEVSENGGAAKKKVMFWQYAKTWDEKNQIWQGNGGSGGGRPWGDNEELFKKAGLYPWPEQGVLE